MKLLIDTNVLLDVFLCREQFIADAKKLFIMKQFRDAELWIAAQSYTDLYYVGAKAHGSDRMQKILIEVFPLLNGCSIDGADISYALDEQWQDFEDCLIWRAAKKIKADYIVTRNAADFTRSDIPTLTPGEFFSTMEAEQNLVYKETEF
ncbi:MAG: PIN domain-containing protein [Lancefieldella rimae]